MTKHLMLDFESLGLGSNAVLIALGACHFCPVTGEVFSHFYSAIDPRLQRGRDIDPSTVIWWLQQGDQARSKITDAIKNTDLIEAGFDEDADPAMVDEVYANAAHPIDQVARAFIAYIDSLESDVEVWTNGAVDHAWLESMMQYSGYKNPIKFWLQRDYRTMKALYPQVKADESTEFVAHDALQDAIKQAKHLAKIIRHVGENANDNVDSLPEPYRAWEAPVFERYGEAPTPALLPLSKVAHDVLSCGYVCGLQTVGEAIANMDHHATSIWPYAEIGVRMAEITKEFETFTGDELIADYLTVEERAKIDADIDVACSQEPDAALALESAFSADDIQQVINEDNAVQQARAIAQTKE